MTQKLKDLDSSNFFFGLVKVKVTEGSEHRPLIKEKNPNDVFYRTPSNERNMISFTKLPSKQTTSF